MARTGGGGRLGGSRGLGADHNGPDAVDAMNPRPVHAAAPQTKRGARGAVTRTTHCGHWKQKKRSPYLFAVCSPCSRFVCV